METKIQGDMPKLEGYKWISKNRTGKEGGGIAIAVRNDLTNNVTRVDDLEDQDQEVIWVEIRSGLQKQFIGVYYGTQENSPIEETKREYSQLTTQIHTLQRRGGVIPTADFNAKLEINDNHIRQNKSRNGKLLGKLIEDTGLTPINKQQGKCKWTRQNRNNSMKKSVIDYILVSKQYVNNIKEINVDEIDMYRLKGKADSDHNTITTTINSNLTTRKRTVEITQINNKEGWSKYNKEITRKYKEDPPKNYTQLHNLIMQTIRETVGIKKIKIGNNNKKESKKAKELRQTKKEKRKILQEAQKMGINQTRIALHEYINAQKNLRECIDEDEKEKTTQTMNRLSKASKMNLNEFWKQNKRILNKGQNELHDTITEDGIKLENPEDAKKHIREYFRDLFQARPGKLEHEHWTEHVQQTVKETDKTMEKLPDPNPITTKEIKQSIRQLRCGKSKGPDNIPKEAMIEADHNVIEIYRTELNKILKERTPPPPPPPCNNGKRDTYAAYTKEKTQRVNARANEG